MLCIIFFHLYPLQISHRHLSLPMVQHVLKNSICQTGEDLKGMPSYAISCQKNNTPAVHHRNSSHLKQQQQGCHRVPGSVWFTGLSRHDFPFLWLCHDQSEPGGLQLVTVGCGGSCWWMSPWGQSQQEHYADQLWGAVTGSQTCSLICQLPKEQEMVMMGQSSNNEDYFLFLTKTDATDDI